jgi:hypothetical protein
MQVHSLTPKSDIKSGLMVQMLLPTGEVKRKATSGEEIKVKGQQRQRDF